jgi:small subunit ribosomal protein S1
MVLGKRTVVLAQRLEDIPTDVRGRVRPILYQAAGLGVAALMQKLKDQLQIARGETVMENTLVALTGADTEPMPGCIVHVTKERALVETESGGHRQFWELSKADADYARLIPDMTRRFTVGDGCPAPSSLTLRAPGAATRCSPTRATHGQRSPPTTR